METFCANYRREESQAFSSGDFHKRRLLRERVHPRVIGARAMHADRFTIISLHAALCPSPPFPSRFESVLHINQTVRGEYEKQHT